VFLVPANVIQNLSKLWSGYIEWPPISSNNSFPCIRELWAGIICTFAPFEDRYNNNQTSFTVTIVILDVTSSGIQGLLPTGIGNLSNLLILSLNGNHFTGSIPSNFGNLTKLIELDLSDNHLTGPIPPDLGNLSRLMLLNLYGNQLNGKIPISSDNSSWGINNLTELVTLQLQENLLSGELPNLQSARFLRTVCVSHVN
jgi:Leucine-rich repeat (LRR) protein